MVFERFGTSEQYKHVLEGLPQSGEVLAALLKPKSLTSICSIVTC
jgi:hypothetical protein